MLMCKGLSTIPLSTVFEFKIVQEYFVEGFDLQDRNYNLLCMSTLKFFHWYLYNPLDK